MNFELYRKIKDNYCLYYSGKNKEFIYLICLLKEKIEKRWPGTNLFTATPYDLQIDINDHKHIYYHNFKELQQQFFYLEELSSSPYIHPVESFLQGCDLEDLSLKIDAKPPKTQQCVIISQGDYSSAKGLTTKQIENAKKIAISLGYYVEMDTTIDYAGLVIGVESYNLCKASVKGIETILIPTGAGEQLYKKIFPNVKTQHI